MVWFWYILDLNGLVWFYSGLVRSEWVCFSVVWCLLVWFGVIYTFLDANQCFMMWFWCDLVLSDLVWFWSDLVRLEVCFVVVWCLLVWFEHFWVLINVLWYDLVLNDFVWFYLCLVRSELVCFGVFGVVWYDLYIFWVLINVLWCDFGVICFWVIWCKFIQVWLDWSGFVLVWFGVFWSFGLVWCDLYICGC